MGSCYNSTVISAPVDDVWKTLRNFHQLNWAKGVITKLVVVGDKKATAVGAKRILNDAFHETLVELNDSKMNFSYSIDDGPGPVAKDAVTNYIGRVSAHAVTDTDWTFVEWRSDFESIDSGAVSKFCNPIYKSLLDALNTHFS